MLSNFIKIFMMILEKSICCYVEVKIYVTEYVCGRNKICVATLYQRLVSQNFLYELLDPVCYITSCPNII